MELKDIDVNPPEMIATMEEMDAENVPHEYRDYCAHLFIKWQNCMRQKFFHWKCHEEELEMEKCHYREHLRALKKRQLKE